MISINKVDGSTLRQSQALLRDEAVKRGWSVSVPYTGSSIMEFKKPNGATLKTHSTTPPTSSYPAAHMVNDKYATHVVLEDAGAPVLPTMLIEDQSQALDYDEILSSLGGSVVVKPIDGGHGNGITVGVTNATDLRVAVETAFALVRSIKKIIIQAMYPNPKDLRLLCINHNFVAATLRIPARVTGDGEHTIQQLIELENQDPKRGEAYVAKLTCISLDEAQQFLGEKIQTIPASGEVIEVLGVANYGRGGETQDCTSDIPQWLIEAAEAASRATDLYVCGVDFLVSEVPRADATPEMLKPAITEVNKAPSIQIHEFPTHGNGVPVSKYLIDYLDTLF